MKKISNDALIHHVMAIVGGFLGAYALINRCENFGSSETSNLIYLFIALLGGSLKEFALRVIAVLLYALGIFSTIIIQRKTKTDIRFFSILIDAVCLSLVSFIPQNVNFIIALYPIFFATAFQWNAFASADGFSSSTIFSTNNLRQTVTGFTNYWLKKNPKDLQHGAFFGLTLLSFHIGVVIAFFASKFLSYRSAFVCFLPLAIAFGLVVRESKRNSVYSLSRIESESNISAELPAEIK